MLLSYEEYSLTFHYIEEEEELKLKQEAQYKTAVAICEDEYVLSVLEDLRTRLEEAEWSATKNASEAAEMTKRYKKGRTAAEDMKKVWQGRLKKNKDIILAKDAQIVERDGKIAELEDRIEALKASA
jgi:hypothetical protein